MLAVFRIRMWVIQGFVERVAPPREVVGLGQTAIPVAVVWATMGPPVSYICHHISYGW